MHEITRRDPVERLGLSPRPCNCLRRAGIDTVGQLLDFPGEKLREIRNMGQKSLAEIQARVARLLEEGPLKEGVPDSRTPGEEPPPLPDILVQELGLSARAANGLQRAGIFSAAEMGKLTRAELSRMSQMGEKTIREILDKTEALRRESAAAREADPASLQKADALLEGFAAFTGQPRSALFRELAEAAKEPPAFKGETAAERLYRRPSVRKAVRRSLLKALEEAEGETLSASALLERMPRGTSAEALEGLLAELEKRDAVTRRDGQVTRRFPTAWEYASARPNERGRRDMLLARLRGETLEEIGKRYDISRERVRQIVQGELKNHPRLHEDLYQEMFNRYEFSLKEFTAAFGEPPEAYYYLESMRPMRRRSPLAELLGDPSVSKELRRRAEDVVYRQFVLVDGVRVEKTRPALAEYAVRSRCRELTGMDEFLERYRAMLEELGLADDGRLAIEERRTYENRLNNCDYVLWNQWRRFRYYPIRQREYGPLLEALNLKQYEDMEITTLKLFRDHPDLMEEYDIRDEYELHNLLRKIWPAEGCQEVDFRKMPTIQIGRPDRDRQVLDLLLQTAPVLNTDFAEKYEALYGAKSTTVLANYLSCISCYLQGSLYRIDMPPLPPAHRERLAETLKEDFYNLSAVRRAYRQAFPEEADMACINAATLRDLGFRVYTDYVVRDTYASAADYFRRLLTRGTADMRETARQFANIALYGSELSDLKARREIVEFSPGQYFSRRRLEEEGVTLERMEDYCSAAAAFVGEEEYFTVESLEEDGFSHPLREAGFESWFYGSLLASDPRFSFRRMGGNRLFRKGRARVVLGDFLVWLMEDLKKTDFGGLRDLLKRRYGVSFQAEKLLEDVRGTALYYDPIMETVYQSYGDYFRESHAGTPAFPSGLRRPSGDRTDGEGRFGKGEV